MNTYLANDQRLQSREPPLGRDQRHGPSRSTKERDASPAMPAGSIWGNKRYWFWSLLLVVLCLTVYFPLRNAEFTNFDDPDYVMLNPHVAGGLSWENFSWALTTNHAGNWFPLTWLSLMLDAELYGKWAGGFHLTNVFLHTCTTVLLFGLLLRLTGAAGRSAFVAALFSVHPLHVESVAWVTERKDVLSGLLAVLSIWAYVSYERKRHVMGYAFLLTALGAGLAAKPMLVTLPFVLLLLDLWPLRRVVFSGGSLLRANRGLLLEKIPLLLLAAISCAITLRVQGSGGAVATYEALPWWFRVENALVSYSTYLIKTLYPAGLAPFYPLPRAVPFWQAIASAAFLIGVTLLVVRSRPRHPYLVVGWFWYVGMLLPVIGVIQVGRQAMADRYTYLPLIGIFLMSAWGATEAARNFPARKIVLWSTAIGAVVLCGVAARAQVRYWRDSVTLWSRTIAVTRDNDFAHNNLGNALADQGRYSEAVDHFHEALRINPRFVEVYTSLGNTFAAHGDLATAAAHYKEALRINPRFAEAHNNLGAVLGSLGRMQDAIAEYREAIRLKPDYATAHYNLANALAASGKVDEAIAEYAETLRLDPSNADAHNNLGASLAARGQFDEAIAHYRAALKSKPDLAAAHNNWGIALAQGGDLTQATRHYRDALRVQPRYAEAENNLANALARQGRFDEAIRQYAAALHDGAENPEIHRNMAAALVAMGRRNEAIDQYRQVLKLRPDDPSAKSALQDLLKQVRQGAKERR